MDVVQRGFELVVARLRLPVIHIKRHFFIRRDTYAFQYLPVFAEKADITNEEALVLYDKYAGSSLDLMLAKNHDYDEAWRSMRISSYTELILMKIGRTKQIESLAGQTLVSEGIDANYMDMINYSVFGLIKIEFGD